MKPPSASRFDTPRPVSRRVITTAVVTIMLGSLVTLAPLVATVPFLPPCGLVVLMAWRLRRNDVFPSWSAAPLGLFDDLVSGQPLGLGIATWTLCLVMVDVLDTRLVWRDFWQDWLIAGGAAGFCLIAGRLAGAPVGAHVDTLVILQIGVAIALFPLAARIVARLDAREDNFE